MNAVRKFKWKISVGADQPHLALEHLLSRTFDMETLDPPPEVGQAFVLFYDDYGSRASPSDCCVEVEVLQQRKLMVYSNGRAHAPEWYVLIRARIVGKADLPW